MSAFFTALIWATLIVTVFILGICLFFCVIGIKGLCNYIADKTDVDEWFDRDELSVYCQQAIKDLFE